MNNKKAKTFTACLLPLMLIALVIFHFFGIYRPSPPGKTIVKTFVYPDGTPIAGLTVALDGVTATTGADGSVTFGGLADGTYTITWSWQGVPYEETVTIDCTKLVWEFKNKLPFWEVCKTFTYPDGTPIVGLDVTLNGVTKTTDADGKVCFSDLKAGTYTISWSWQGVASSETVTIDFATPSPVVLENELPCWTLIKYFYYDLPCSPPIPIVGLKVTLDGQTATTDAEGKVVFTCLQKCVKYTLEWVWCGKPYSKVIHIESFDTESPIVLVNRLPAKYIKVGVFCEETEEPVPAGLKVSVSGTIAGKPFTDIKYTGADGYTDWFGSGYPDGTYIIKFYWCGERTYKVTIDCTQQYWTFNYYVPNPVIIKHFVYEESGEPIVGLNVTLVEEGVAKAWKLTDETGTVEFGGDLVAACKEYYLKYSWGGTEYSVGPIHFEYIEGELRVCEWEETNRLEPKGGGGT